MFIQDSHSKLKLCENEDDVWYELLDFCLDFVAEKDTIEILGQDTRRELPVPVIDEILERHF